MDPKPKKGRLYRWKRRGCDFEFWAQNGLVNLLDLNLAAKYNCRCDAAYKKLAPGDFMRRVLAVCCLIGENNRDKGEYSSCEDRFLARQLLENGAACAKEAKAQGDPTDPEVLDWILKHNKKTQILVPGLNVNDGKTKYKINFTNEYDMLWNGVEITRKPNIVVPS